jgi:hypothetical protein
VVEEAEAMRVWVCREGRVEARGQWGVEWKDDDDDCGCGICDDATAIQGLRCRPLARILARLDCCLCQAAGEEK